MQPPTCVHSQVASSPVHVQIEEVLEEYSDGPFGGPFFAGRDVTAADIYWAPFLERFAAHLPLLYRSLSPRR